MKRLPPTCSSDRARLNRRDYLRLGGGLATAALLAACGSPAPPAGTAGPPTQMAAERRLADRIVYASTRVSSGLDPHGNPSISSFQSPRQIFDALVALDDKGERIVPQLATEWKRIDPLTMELKLRDGVKFSNGEDFTAETVKFNVDRILTSKDVNLNSVQSRMGPLAGAEVVNSTTVRVRTKDPDPVLLNRLAMVFMAPERYTRNGGDLNSAPVGTGTYKVTRYQTSVQIDLEAWDGTWRGKTPVKTARMAAINEQAGLISALRTGEIDVAWDVQGDVVQGLRNDFKVGSQNNASCTVVSMLPLVPAFQDKRVRQALNYAVNKDELVKTLRGGFGKVAQGQLLQPGMLGYDDSLKAYPYDPEKARSLLREAGITSLNVDFITSAVHKTIAEAVVGYLKGVGVTASLRVLEPAIFLRHMTTKTDAPLIIWNTDYFHLRDFDAAAQRFALQEEQPRFPNQEFKDLFLATRRELDTEKRAQLIKRAAGLMHEEAPCIFLFWDEVAIVYSKKIEALPLPYDKSVPLWKVEKAV